MRITKNDLLDLVRVINRQLGKNGYKVRLELEYRPAAYGGSNVYYLDINGSRAGWPILTNRTPKELNDLLKMYWKGLSVGLMASYIENKV